MSEQEAYDKFVVQRAPYGIIWEHGICLKRNLEYEMSMKKGTRDTVLYEIENMGPRKLQNVGIWEEEKYQIRNVD